MSVSSSGYSGLLWREIENDRETQRINGKVRSLGVAIEKKILQQCWTTASAQNAFEYTKDKIRCFGHEHDISMYTTLNA